MYDIFDEKLTDVASKYHHARVPAVFITSSHELSKNVTAFTVANNTDRSLFKAGVRMFADLELLEKKDNLHHRNSGLDTTEAKLCAAQHILVGISLKNLRTLDPVIIGRVMQNIELCRSHGAQMAVFSNATSEGELMHENDVHSLLLTLGMSPSQAKQTLGNLERAYKEFLFEKSPQFIKKGVKKVS